MSIQVGETYNQIDRRGVVRQVVVLSITHETARVRAIFGPLAGMEYNIPANRLGAR